MISSGDIVTDRFFLPLEIWTDDWGCALYVLIIQPCFIRRLPTKKGFRELLRRTIPEGDCLLGGTFRDGEFSVGVNFAEGIPPWGEFPLRMGT